MGVRPAAGAPGAVYQGCHRRSWCFRVAATDTNREGAAVGAEGCGARTRDTRGCTTEGWVRTVSRVAVAAPRRRVREMYSNWDRDRQRNPAQRPQVQRVTVIATG